MDPEEHAKQYKLFAPAFRASALRSQEHIIHKHVDLFISQLGRLGVSAQKSLNMSLWFEWLTFDIIGMRPGSVSRLFNLELTATHLRRAHLRGIFQRHTRCQVALLGHPPSRFQLRWEHLQSSKTPGVHWASSALGPQSFEDGKRGGQMCHTASGADPGEDQAAYPDGRVTWHRGLLCARSQDRVQR